MRGITIFFIVVTLVVANSSTYSQANIQPTSINPNYFNGDTLDFSAEIYYVGRGSDTRLDKSNQIQLSEWGTIDATTDTSFTLFAISLNLTGLLWRDFGVVTINDNPVDLGMSLVFGQMYTILDGKVGSIIESSLGPNGLVIPIPLGDHTLNVIYIAMDENDNYYYATDTIVFRIRRSDDFTGFTEYVTLDAPLNLTYTDVYEDRIISGDVITYLIRSFPDGLYDLNYLWEPEVETNIRYESKAVMNDQELIFILNETNQIDLSVNTNSTGFNDIQIFGEWESTRGISFLLDATGMHEIDDSLTEASIRDGNNYLGVITLAPYGIWHGEIPEPYSGERNDIPDWDTGMESTMIGTDEQIAYRASFDFVHDVSGINFRAAIGEQTTVTSNSNDSPISLWWMLMALPILRRKRK